MTVVGIGNIEKLAQALKESGEKADVTTHETLIEAANFILTEMIVRVPVRTGELRGSLRVAVDGNRVVIGPTAEHGPFVEFGTKPHRIEPKNKKALAFTVGGRRVIVTHVDHPGTKAQPYVRPAFDAWKREIAKMVGEANVRKITEAVNA